MPAARIIPCLDVRDGRVVKGVQFRDHRDIGDIVEHALRYRDEGADELVFYDITASAERRSLDTAWVRRIAEVIDIPFAVAGGIRSRDEAAACLDAGADKISINSPAIERSGADRDAGPRLRQPVRRARRRQLCRRRRLLGQAIYRQRRSDPRHRPAGRSTGCARRRRAAPARSCSTACAMTACAPATTSPTRKAVIDAVTVPVIASGGAGAPEHFRDAFAVGASGALAATVFHDRLIAIPDLKEYLAPMRDRSAPLTEADLAALDWEKMDGLLPAIVQDAATLQVLMLGYMNREALAATLESGFATFFSRSKGRLWQKGETAAISSRSKAVLADCDDDALLVLAEPAGPTCHLGTTSCFGEAKAAGRRLARQARPHRPRARRRGARGELHRPPARRRSRRASPRRSARKGSSSRLPASAGEREACIEEAADLLYHVTVLMEARGFGWSDVAETLRKRHG